MFDWILLGIGIVGFGLAGYWDLKTTEFPDWLPYLIIVAALAVRGIWAWAAWDAGILINSVYVGVGLLVFGLLLYLFKQWGDGDAWLLGALGFLFPVQSGLPMLRTAFTVLPYPLVLVFNFFFISFIYLVLYSLAIGLRSPKVWKGFTRELRGATKTILAAFFVLLVACLAILGYLTSSFGIPVEQLWIIALFPFLLLGILVFLQYGRFIEESIFKRRIPARKIKAGDVPIDSKWRVLNEKEVARIKRAGGKIWIKEGVRLAPVFLITLLATVFWGTLFF